jgi:hypothetical protein
VFQACVLGLSLQGFESRFRNHPPLTMNETAYPPLPHRVTRATL